MSAEISYFTDLKNSLYLYCCFFFFFFQVFINRGATLNILDSHGRSPLVLAIASRNNGKKVISSLLQLGAKIDFSSDDKSPLLASFYNLKREVDMISQFTNYQYFYHRKLPIYKINDS